jgi:hypothetical protein
MEAVCSSETLVDFHRTTWHYIPEDNTLDNHRCENLKSYKKEPDSHLGEKITKLKFSQLKKTNISQDVITGVREKA